MKPSDRIEQIRVEMVKGKGLIDATNVTFIISAILKYLDEEYANRSKTT